MSILSDKQIRALCVPPETWFDQKGYDERDAQGHAVPLGDWARKEYFRKFRESFVHPTTQEMKDAFVPMISPYNGQSVRSVTIGGDDVDGASSSIVRKVLSYGSTSYGYDVSLGEEFKIFTNVRGGLIDPKKLDSAKCLVDGTVEVDEEGAKFVILPPNSYLLGVTVEYFRMPRDVVAICLGKSTYARAGAIVNVTPIEPGFEGNVVIEIANSTSLPMKIYANEGISQFCFFQGTEACEVSYADRGGKYQGQTGVRLGEV